MKLFIDDLCKTGKLKGLNFTYWDESFTSKVGPFGYIVRFSEVSYV